MHEVLQQLASIPGVVGALTCGPRGELLASAFPPLFDELVLHQVAAFFSDDTSGFRQMAGPDGSLDVRYARGRAVARPFPQGTLVVIGTPAVDAQLLGISMEQAARRLEGAQRPQDGPFPTPGRSAVPPEVASAREPLQEALVSFIGPIGELVFAEAWADWAAKEPPTRAGLQKLVAALSREVDDEAERARFVAAARAAIR